MNPSFSSARLHLDREFTDTAWIPESGLSDEELNAEILRIESSYSDKATVKAKVFEAIALHSRIAIDEYDIFQDKLFHGSIMNRLRKTWEDEVKNTYFPSETAEIRTAHKECGAYNAHTDFGHTSPNTRLLLRVGFSGLLQRVNEAAAREGLSEKQIRFYNACKTVLLSEIAVARRLADAIRPHNRENADALLSIAEGAPKSIYEAMQLLILSFFLHEYVAGTRVRTLGRLDVLLRPFYEADLASGRYTKDEIREMMRFFLYKFWVAKVPFDLLFCIGGSDPLGGDVTSEVSYLIVDVYDELGIYSPKIHVRVSKDTPESFVKRVLSCIRGGHSSFVFVNDAVAVKALSAVGIEEADAVDYVPIGCYEPAVWGVEIGCTGNGYVNLPKALELALNGGRDLKTGFLCGTPVSEIRSYEELLSAVKSEIAVMTERVASYVTAIERHYEKIFPDPILSAQYDESVRRGVDVFEGGAKYNNSSLYFYSIASLVDSLLVLKRFVYDEKRLSLSKFTEILKNDWAGAESLRRDALLSSPKYGNNDPVADALTADLLHFAASLVNGRPNGRGGVFKASSFTIDHYLHTGAKTMATPDGRHAGDPLSKNYCAAVGMDRHGVTALIGSVTKIDHSEFPNGSVLDVVLHPSAVAGEDGLSAFYALLMTYMKRGGFALHGNVFSVEELRAAQKAPEKYRNLQVRVCGWNAYFVSLTKTEQDAFIEQAEKSHI